MAGAFWNVLTAIAFAMACVCIFGGLFVLLSAAWWLACASATRRKYVRRNLPRD